MIEWLPLMDAVRTHLDLGMALLIWLVQLIIYPSFLYANRELFQEWHYRYTGLITLFVMPLMFGQLAIYLYSGWLANRWFDWVGLALIGLCWAATFWLSVPCHESLQKKGFDTRVIRRLVATNWYRTCGWSSLCLLDLAAFLLNAD